MLPVDSIYGYAEYSNLLYDHKLQQAGIASKASECIATQPQLPFLTMKHQKDNFVLINASAPKKQRQKASINYGQLINFGTTPLGLGSGSGSDSLRYSLPRDENQSSPMLGSPWTPLRRFKTWHPSTLGPGPEPERTS